MGLRSDLATQLIADPGVGKYVDESEIYFGIATGTTWPAIIIEVGRQENTALQKSGLTRFMVVLTVVSQKQAEAEELGNAVAVAIDRQVFGAVKSITLKTQEESTVSDDGDSDRIFYSQVITFSALYAGET